MKSLKSFLLAAFIFLLFLSIELALPPHGQLVPADFICAHAALQAAKWRAYVDEDADVWLITVDGGHDAIEAMEASATGPKQAFERLDQSLPLLPDLASEGLKGAMVDLVSGKRSTKANGQLIEQYLRALIQHPLLSDSPALLQFPNTFSQEDKLGSDSRWMTMYKQASNVTEKAAKKKLQAMADKW